MLLKSVSHKTLFKKEKSMIEKEVEELLSSCLIFEGCPSELIKKTVNDPRCATVTYEKGKQVLFEKGALGVVLSGRVGVGTLRRDSDLVLNQHERGSVFGFSSLSGEDGAAFCSDLRARCKTEVLFIGEDLLLELMANEHRVARNVIAYQAAKIRFLNGKIRSLTCKDAGQRLYLHLKSLPQGEDGSLLEALNMAALAKRLNISRASLYRVLDKLVEDGKIEKSGNTLIIKEDYSRKEE